MHIIDHEQQGNRENTGATVRCCRWSYPLVVTSLALAAYCCPFFINHKCSLFKCSGSARAVRETFEPCAHHQGVSLDGRCLPWLQLGPIPWNTYPFLRMLCKAFFLLRKKAPVATPRDELIPGMPLWHSVWFKDTHNNTY